MRSEASCRVTQEFAAPTSISPIPKAPTRQTAAARSESPCSFDVLHLLAEFFNLRFDFERDTGDGQSFTLDAGRLGEHGVGFAMHLLQKKMKFLSQLADSIQPRGKLRQLAPQSV